MNREAQPDPDPGATDDEAVLVERSKRGDRDATDELFRRHIDGVHAYIRLKRSPLLHRHESSMDAVQSVFRQALRDLDTFEYRGPRSLRNWLLTYAENRLRNQDKFHRAARRGHGRTAEQSLSQVYASMCSPSQLAGANEGIDEFERAFDSLSDSDREILMLATFEQLSHAEIADRLGITVAASKKALSRAKFRLADKLGRA